MTECEAAIWLMLFGVISIVPAYVLRKPRSEALLTQISSGLGISALFLSEGLFMISVLRALV
jgi:hypothetical protein